MNQMLKAALWYAEMGWHIFPIVPRRKEPMTKNGVLDASCDTQQIEKWWEINPDANIGLQCGAASGVYVVDVDVDTEKNIDGFLALADLTDKWPDTVTQLTPRGGKHFFFQTKDPPRNKNNFKEGIDIRSQNFYILLTPSLHPNGKRYVWAENRAPLDFPFATFPPYVRPEKIEIVPVAPLPPIDISSDERLRRASAYLATCAPAEQGRGGHNALFWAATAMVHGFELADNEALTLLENEYNPRCLSPWNLKNPRDLKDFRRKVDEARRCPPGKPLGWLLRETGVEVDPEFDKQVDKLLEEELNEVHIDSGNMFICYNKELAECETREFTGGGMEELTEAEISIKEKIQKQETIERLLIKEPKEKRDLKKRIYSGHSGMLKDLVEWIDRTGFKQQPMLTIACALSFLGALFGRKLRDEHGSRTNIYTMGVAASSAGKAHAMKCVRHLAHVAGAGDLIGGSSVGSDIAVINKLAKYKSILYMWDEVGFLLANVKSVHAGPNKMLIPTLMSLYSASSDVFVGREYADLDKQVKLTQPCCCLYGTSEIDRFVEGLNPRELNDGWLSRCLVFRADKEAKLEIDNPCFEGTAPESLIKMVGEWYHRTIGDPDKSQEIEVKHGVVLEPLPEQIVVPTTDEAEIHFRKFISVCNKKGKKTPKVKSLWDKAHENARRIALIVAGASDFYKPQITAEMAEYACDLMEYILDDFTVTFVDDIIDSRNAEANRRVFRFIHERRTTGCTKTKLTANTIFIRRHERNAIIDDLIEGGQIVSMTPPPRTDIKHPGRPVTIYYSAESYRNKIYEDRTNVNRDASTKQGASPELPSSVDRGADDEGSSDKAIPQDGSTKSGGTEV